MQSDATVAAVRSLDGVTLLGGLAPEALRALEAQCRWLSLAPDQCALNGDGGGEIYFVISGRVRVVNRLGDGREVQLTELGAGDTFGELSAVDLKARSAEVVGAEPCLLAALPGAAFRQLLTTYPEVAIRLIEQLAEVVRSTNARLSAVATPSPRQRVYAELLRLAAPSPSGDRSWVIDRVPTHDELAAAADATKQDVAMAIGALARDGILERRHRSLVVRDQPRLRVLADM